MLELQRWSVVGQVFEESVQLLSVDTSFPEL
jgi:hypothetical protein